MKPIDYTQSDFESLRCDLVARIPQLTPAWTDLNPTDPGMVLLELFCGLADMLARYLDELASEAYLSTAQHRQNVINLCALIGYQLKGPVAASTTLTFTSDQNLDRDLTISQGTHCRAIFPEGDLDFLTTQAVTIPRGERVGHVSARQGIEHTDTFEATGQSFQSYQLTQKDIAEGSIAITVGEQAFQIVPHFQESDAQSPHLVITRNAKGIITLDFGDGGRGAIPANQATIKATYLRTSGKAGNLAANTIKQLMSLVNDQNAPASLKVTNTVPATGGADAQDHTEARKQAPAQIQSLYKAVTATDYQALALGFPGVAKVALVDLETCPSIHRYLVNLVIAPNGGGPPSQALLDDLAAFLDQRKTITTEVRLFQAQYIAIPVRGNVFYFAGQDAQAVKDRTEAALQAFFDFDAVDFSQNIHTSDIITVIDQIEGVSHGHLVQPTSDTPIGPGQLPILGPVTLTLEPAQT